MLRFLLAFVCLACAGVADAQVRVDPDGTRWFCSKSCVKNGYGEDSCSDTCYIMSNGGAGNSRPSQSFGAIANSASDVKIYGYSYGYGSRREAEGAAVRQCEAQANRKGDCQANIWFYNQCAAIATSPGGAWGEDHADTKQQASANALSRCRKYDKACKVQSAFCSF